jgi:oxysterol-binding protein-related protein 9/10/11
MIEYSTYWAEHPSLFVAPALESDPEKRMVLVLKWFLSTLKQQHSLVDENGQKKKLKPLNPFLGEVFQGKWVDSAGETKLVAEQVSHHPPITAFNCWNARHGVWARFFHPPCSS